MRTYGVKTFRMGRQLKVSPLWYLTSMRYMANDKDLESLCSMKELKLLTRVAP